MAELKGVLKFVGSLGNIRVYYNSTLKRYIVATKGSTPKALIKNNPAFALQRANMAEFGGCAIWASLLRTALFKLEHLFGGYYFSGFMALAKTIQKHDEMGKRGFRAVESSKDAYLLSSVVFNKLHLFDQVFSQRVETFFSNDRKTITLTLPEFISRTRITWPERFTRYRLALLIAQLSDMAWDEGEKCYKPVVAGLELRSVLVYGDWRKTGRNPENVVLTASFKEPALQQPGALVVAVMGIEIGTGTAGSQPDDVSGIGTMKIVECFA
jgi:hypothetical protein